MPQIENQTLNELQIRLVELHEDECQRLALDLLANGIDHAILKETFRPALMEIGERFENGHYFASSLIPVGQTIRKIMASIYDQPGLEPFPGRVLLVASSGLSREDNLNSLLSLVLGSLGFEVWDVGEESAPDALLAEARQFKPHGLGFLHGRPAQSGRIGRLVKTLKENWPQNPKPFVFLAGSKAEALKRATRVDFALVSVSGALAMYHSLLMTYPFGSFTP
ncbi:MAG: B12-binding domain-containing protein [Deltaproteobacteria bacterium]|nr:B12-binding domain-containing protein [Deltaproteobacteria bacterium]